MLVIQWESKQAAPNTFVNTATMLKEPGLYKSKNNTAFYIIGTSATRHLVYDHKELSYVDFSSRLSMNDGVKEWYKVGEELTLTFKNHTC